MNKRSWEHDINLLKDTSIVITVWKIVTLVSFFPVFILLVCELLDGDLNLETLGEIGKVYFLIAGIMTGLLLFSYYIFFLPIKGIHYLIIFEMDDIGINHIMGKKQRKKAKILSWVGTIFGIMAKSPTVVGSSVIAGSRQSMYTKFKDIKKIIVYTKRSKLKLISKDLTRNIIYTSKEDFEEIYEYIKDKSNKKVEILMK